MTLQRKNYPIGEKHRACESGVTCRECFWIAASNGYIGGLEFALCLIDIEIKANETPCSHEKEDCIEQETSHGEARRKMASKVTMLKEIREMIVNRAKSEL